MSDIPKKVDEPTAVTAVTEAPAATEPVTDVKPTETSTETAATTIPAATEDVKPVGEAVPAVEEVKPVEEGILGYKGPGLLKGLIFSKKFFWFGSEPVEEKHLSNYLRGEKDGGGNHNAAWASHTGKGLLFFTKKAADKATPASIINLADISEVTLDGAKAFHFTENSHKHVFEAENVADRDNWVSQIKAKSAEAKEVAPAITEHETYKSTFDKLKTPVVAAAIPKKSTEVKKEETKEEKKEEKAEAKEEKKEEKAEAKEEKKEEKVIAKEEKKSRKSRSASRKRNSIFGGFGSKKEEKKEEKIEAPKQEETAVVAPVEATPEVAATEPIVETAAVEPTAPVEPAAAVEEGTPVVAETKPANKKRNSIFGTFKSYVSDSKVKKEDAPVVPAKDVVEPEPVSETAPVIPAVESTEPLATSVASPATVPTETATPAVTNGETKATETPVAKTDKRKSSLPWLSKKEKPTSDDEAEKPKSPFLSRVIGTVKGKKAEKTTPAEKSAETEAPVEEPAATETTTPVAPAAPAANPTVAATA